MAEALTAGDPAGSEADGPYRAASRGDDGGFYVDIEAGHPVEDGVSLGFHRRGWRGVNVVSDAERFRLFAELRPEDTTVNAVVDGVSEAGGTAPRDDARSPVPKLSLSEVLDRYGPSDGRISFLKISAGAHTASILRGSDWVRHRPDVIALDAQAPDDAWDDGSRPLSELGYRLAFFDGRRRIFVRAAADRDAPGSNLRRGGNRPGPGAGDRRRSSVRSVEARLDALGHDAEEARAELREARSELAVARAAAACAESSLADLRVELESLRAAAGTAEARVRVLSVERARALEAAAVAQRREEAVEAELAVQEGLRHLSPPVPASPASPASPAADMEIVLRAHRGALLHHQRAHAELALWRESVRVSTSWRLTRPMRVVGRYLKRLYRVRRR